MSSVQLVDQKCTACRSGDPVLSPDEITKLLPQVPGWDVVEENGVKHLEQVFKFTNFSEALAFTDRVGQLAEAEGHHPQITTEWGQVRVKWWTHKIGGLHRNDFVMAAKTAQIYGSTGHDR